MAQQSPWGVFGSDDIGLRSVVMPTVVLEPATLGDLELVLSGVLPTGHALGGPVDAGRPFATDPQAAVFVRLTLPAPTADAAATAGGLTLADHELTPLATLHVVTADPPLGHTVVVSGLVRPERPRESGEGRSRTLRSDDRYAGYTRVVVLARPALLADHEGLGSCTGPTLIVVPDDPRATDGVPTAVMLGIADRLAGILDDAQVRTAPLRWRSAESDRALVDRLAGFLGAPTALLLHPDPQVDDRGAAQWRTLRACLDEARADGIPLDGLTEADADALRRWRPPRPRRGLVVMFTGFSGSGKSTLARSLKDSIASAGERTVSLLDGDIVRQLLSSGLGFDRESRILNSRRIGYVAAEVARHGGIAICAPVAPYASTRQEVREMAEAVGDFVLVHVSTPLAECERRDLKGLYAKARAGLVPEFTGISDPYEAPDDADLSIDTTRVTPGEALDMLDDYLRTNGWPGGPRSASTHS